MAQKEGCVSRRLLLGIVLLAAAALAAALARDVWLVQDTLRDADARADVASVSARSYDAAHSVPFDPAGSLLGVDDDVAYRALVLRALQLAREGAATPTQARKRAPVESALQRIETAADDPRRAAEAAVILGVLVGTDPEDPARRVETPTEKAAKHFRTAIRLDPSNVDAKRNLELVLQQERTQNQRGRSTRGGGDIPGGGGAGLAPPGGGY
jgi:hypothetical protein